MFPAPWFIVGVRTMSGKKSYLFFIALLLFVLLAGAACSAAKSSDDDNAAPPDDDSSSSDDDATPGDDDTTPGADDDTTPDDDAVDDDADDDVDDDAVDDDADDDTVIDDDAADDDSVDDDTIGGHHVPPVHLVLRPGCNLFTTSEECYLPYPSAFFQDPDPTSPTGVRVDYPPDTIPTGLMPAIDMGPTNTADGVSPAGPILAHFGVDVDAAYLVGQRELYKSYYADSPIALFNYDTGQRVMFMSEMDMNRKDNFPNRYVLIVRPMEPMAMGQRHLVVLTTDLRDANGQPLTSPDAFVVLRDRILTTNPQIEAIRQHYEEIFAFLAEHGYARDKVLLAWDFMVASKDYLLGSVLSMRETALQESGGHGMGYTITRVVDNPNDDLARIVEGDFEVPNYLNADNEIDFDADHHPIRQTENAWFPFTIIIPQKAVTLGQPLPLVVFGHGIFGNGRDYLENWPGPTIQHWAQEAGIVMVATDWIGLSDGDLQLIIDEVIPNLNHVSLVTDRLQQSLINNLVLTELTLGDLQQDGQVAFGGQPLIDTTRVYYYGVSLGGIQGSSFVSLSNRIQRGVLAVPGCVWLNLIPRSIVWTPIKFYMDLFYPDPIVQQMGIVFFQTRFDLSDPVNLTRLMFKDPLPDAPAGRAVVLQEAIGDCEVPNMTTEMLARAIGVKLMTPSIDAVFGLDEVASPATDSAMSQYELVDHLGYTPPDENVPPTEDNGVHTDMCFLDNALDQVLEFETTGQDEQFCSGPCDPN